MSNIERLLRLSADFHNFCGDAHKMDRGEEDPEELSLEELDFVAAAAALTAVEPEKDPNVK